MSLFTSEEHQKEIVALFLEGKSLRQIEIEHSIPRKSLSRWLKENGIQRKPLLSQQQLKEAFERIDNGDSIVKVSQELNIPRQTLYTLFVQTGFISPLISIPSNFDVSKEHKAFMSGESLESISTRYEISASHVRTIFKEKGLPTSRPSRTYTLNEDYFKTIDSSDKAYWLGFIYADGSISTGLSHVLEITLKSSDINHLENFKEFIESNAPISERTIRLKEYEKEYQAVRLNVCSKTFIKHLQSHGIHPNKSLTKQLPDIPSIYHDSFFLGYFDGNGSASKESKYFRLSIHSGSYEFIASLKDISRTLGFTTSDVKKVHLLTPSTIHLMALVMHLF